MALHYLLVACAGGGAVNLLDAPNGEPDAGVIAGSLAAVGHWFDGGLEAGAKKAGEFCCAWTLQQVPFTFPWSDNDPRP